MRSTVFGIWLGILIVSPSPVKLKAGFFLQVKSYRGDTDERFEREKLWRLEEMMGK